MYAVVSPPLSLKWLKLHVCPYGLGVDPYYETSLMRGVEYAKLMDMKPWDHLAPEILDSDVEYEGDYVNVEALLRRLWDEADPSQPRRGAQW